MNRLHVQIKHSLAEGCYCSHYHEHTCGQRRTDGGTVQQSLIRHRIDDEILRPLRTLLGLHTSADNDITFAVQGNEVFGDLFLLASIKQADLVFTRIHGTGRRRSKSTPKTPKMATAKYRNGARG